MTLSFLSVCDGMGCASLAFAPLGWRQILSSEIEAAPRSVLEHHIGARDVRVTKHARTVRDGYAPALWGDFSALRVRHLVRFGIDLPDVLCGGTPCQDFSVAGLRAGLSGARGGLTLSFIRLANAIDAARRVRGLPGLVIFWENVPGVFSHKNNPFGNVVAAMVGEDAAIRPAGGKWTDAGLAVGPARAAAWRLLDSQYFGLAQRRERVFVVASARDGFDPAAVLLEWEGLRRNTPPSREAGTRVAPTVAGGARERGEFSYDDIPLAETFGERGLSDYGPHSLPCLRAKGGEAAGGSEALVAHAFGGNDTRGPIDVATALNAHGGPHGRMDFETETFVAEPVACSIMPQNSSRDYKAREVEVAQPLMAGGPVGGNQGGDYVVQPVAFNLSPGRPGEGYTATKAEVTHALTAEGEASKNGRGLHVVAYPINPNALRSGEAKTPSPDAEGRVRLRDPGLGIGAAGDPADTLTAAGPGAVAVAFALRGREGGAMPEIEGAGDTVGTLRAANGGSSRDYVAFDTTQITSAQNRSNPQPGDPCHPLAAAAHAPAIAGAAAVRRLTPVECCRLQGVPDDYFAPVLHRGKPLADGPIYKMLGNGWSIPAIAWIGRRIDAELRRASALAEAA